MDIGMIVRERDCIAEIVMCSTGTRQWLRMMTTTSTIEDNNMKGEQWTRDRVSIAEDAQITAQHESGHELSTARASAACSMAWPRSTMTRSPRMSIAEDALIIWRNWVDRHATVIHGPSIDDMQHGHVENGIENPWNWNWTCKSMETEWTQV